VHESVGVMPVQDDARALVVGIAQILETGLMLDTTINPASLHLPQGEDARVIEPVRVQGVLTKMAEQVYFQGQISGVVAVPCSRCLDIVHTDFMAEIQVIFLPSTSPLLSDEEGGGSAVNELDLYVHDGITIDLRPLVREQVVLSFPVQSLCREDCAGLCQVCGKNQNRESCVCQTEHGDPRFAILKQLRLSGSSEGG
jgi:uncharacterized protein